MRRAILVVVLAGLACGTGVAGAMDRDVRFYGLGPRVGLSIDPNQFVFGGHMDLGDPLPHLNLILPVLEVGVGDNVTLTMVGADLLFRFTDRWGVWTPYVGSEIAFVFANAYGAHGDTDADLGLMGIFGVEKGIGENNRFATELKFEIIDSPSVKMLATWTFGH